MEASDISYIQHILPTLEGWCTVEKATILYQTILTLNSPICVELGVFAGRSLVAIAKATKLKKGKCYGVDAWSKDAALVGTNSKENDEWWGNIDYEHFYQYTKKVLKEANVSDVCTLFRNKTSEIVDLFSDNSIDFLHQDGNHSEEVTTEEVNRWCQKVKIGGYWAFDDADWPTTKHAQQLLIQKGYELLSKNDGKWFLYKRVL
jgi:predicted O-methyltransferase YrrM